MAGIRQAIVATLQADNPQTLRGLFYQLVGRGIVPKTEAAYKGIVGRLCGLMRREGDLPFDWLADNTRWMRKPTSYTGIEQVLRRTAQTYRRDLWDNQDAYVEVWLEKEALAGVLVEATTQYDVPLMVTRGYPSLSFLHSAAETIAAVDKPTYLYYLGDHDPSGVDIPRKVEEDLRAFLWDEAPRLSLTFTRLAVTPAQIRQFSLPTRPTKRTDTRARRFAGESTEVDAIPAAWLRALVVAAIEQHIDQAALDVVKVAEHSQRELLARLAAQYRRIA